MKLALAVQYLTTLALPLRFQAPITWHPVGFSSNDGLCPFPAYSPDCKTPDIRVVKTYPAHVILDSFATPYAWTRK
ncbi:MAG: hypothetical protein ACI934_000041 [Pseudohongiellaceae bacterium]